MFGNRSRSAEEHIATGYLVTHLCGAMVGLQLSRSLSDSYGVWADGELDSLPGELEYEIEQLLQLIEDTQGISLPRYSKIDATVNRIRRLVHVDAIWRNRLVKLATLEIMRTALCGKSAMWEVLRDIPAGETEEQYRELNDLVSKQITTVTALHHRAATEAFQGTDGRESASGGDPIRSSK
ncbi:MULTISPECIES: hypothetical protein [Rhodococcus]|jgi:hypothetical protein|uniref:hypothetical protein n=1 Tax=Rhodococcus TaxID=1827 RepID=UPI0002F352F3|nr:MULTISPECIES: hypothetical protein [Rhodococcus]MCD2154634.1 hypothetical protein [Rhodococcus cerastii]AKD97076.1 hypothetical protein XU06_10190 [Rhodococcus erythropolis]MBS2988638.1 hypothetical protein [Rhodococcus erythropolis]MBY6385694.1 hypothetical protein [Rhodococcus erythropolis]MCS4254245.1 hypothetical protein [Rhodococcus erythropolis]